MNCPKCSSEIQTENINIQSDIAQCIKCKNIFKISENIEDPNDKNFSISNNPDGTWFKTEFNETIIGASTRSAVAFFLVPFMLVWSGGSLGGIYGSQIKNGEFNLLISLFGIPFILGSLLFWSLALMAIWGKVEITLNNKGGKIFTGIGSIGKTKHFLWSDVSTIKESQPNLRYPGSQGRAIVLEGKKRMDTAAFLRGYTVDKGCILGE